MINPQISIIICTYNRQSFLPGALNSLVHQTVPPENYEIIIVNNNSTDNTERISFSFIESNSNLNVKYFVEINRGLSSARNRGIKESSSELVAFIDDDAEVPNDYIETALDFFKKNPGIDAIGGKIIPVYETGNEPEWLSKPLWGLVTKVDWGNQTRKYPLGKYPAGCSMIFRKKIFKVTGTFNTNLFLRSDDKHIFSQLRAANKLFLYHPKLIVKHHIAANRVTLQSAKKISLSVGGSERVRLQHSGTLKKFLKIIEYIFKLAAALIMAIGFSLKFQFKKAEYIVRNRWYTLLGYFITRFK